MTARNCLRSWTMMLGALGLVSLGTLRLAAQVPAKERADEPSKSATTTAKKAVDVSRRVPPFFGQIGLSPDQKEEIYKIRAKHQEKIDALEKQMVAIRTEMMTECESKLTESQKQSLENRRASVESKKAKATVSTKPSSKGSN